MATKAAGTLTLDAEFGRLDPQQRRVLHPWATYSGLNTSHYLAFDKAEAACAGLKTYYADGKEHVVTNDPTRYLYMPTEFMHGLFDGGAGAGLEDYWRLMMSSPLCAGGFIWALTDDAVKRPDTGVMDTAGNQAPDGIVGPYREREGSFYTIKELWSPIQVTRTTNGQLRVENHYGFTDAHQCRFTWQLRRFPRPFEARSACRVVEEGGLSAPGIPPGGTGVLQAGLPARGKEADAFALRVSDPNGRELWTWVWPLPRLDTWPEMVNVSSRQVGARRGNRRLHHREGRRFDREHQQTHRLAHRRRTRRGKVFADERAAARRGRRQNDPPGENN